MNFIDEYMQIGLFMETPSYRGERGNGAFEGL